MSPPYLPAELLDQIVDRLHDKPILLKRCCLVSKSWIPRTRKHLFANIAFHTAEQARIWEHDFPDPSTSPAYYTKSLHISSMLVADAGASEGGWLANFSRVVHLTISNLSGGFPGERTISLVIFHGFTSTIKSLSIMFYSFPPSHLLNFIYSFPLLENLSLTAYTVPTGDLSNPDEELIAIEPSIQPPFNGCLTLWLMENMGYFARQLLSTPGGIHFRRLDVAWNYEKDVPLTNALAEKCHSTLESLRISHQLDDERLSRLIDLSRLANLKEVEFATPSGAQWIVMALRTITPDHRNLQQISLQTSLLYHSRLHSLHPTSFRYEIGQSIYREWSSLDRLLLQLWESHSIRSRVLFTPVLLNEPLVRSFAKNLLPMVTAREIIDVSEQRGNESPYRI